MSALIPPGGQIDTVEHLASFVVDSVKSMGRGHKGREKYYITVKIDGDEQKEIAFHTCSKTLEIAYEMIEVIGRETKGLNADEFKDYLNEHKGKRIWFGVTDRGTGDLVSTYQTDRFGHSLVPFPLKPTHSIIEHRVREQLRENARLQKSRVDNAVDLNDQPLRVKLKRRDRHPVNHNPVDTNN